jgi:hypothetical protein
MSQFFFIAGQEEVSSGETEGAAGAWFWVQLGPVLVALISLSTNDGIWNSPLPVAQLGWAWLCMVIVGEY